MEIDQPRLLPSVLVPEHAGTKRTTRDWVVDFWCFLAALIIGAIAFAAAHDKQDYPEWFVLWDLVAGFVACLAVWTRRRHPLGLALALTLLAVVSSGASGAAVIALFTLAVHRPFRQAAPVAGLALLTMPLNLLLFPGDEQFIVNAIVGVLAIGGVLAWGMFVRARRQLVFSLRDRALRAETEQQLRVEQARQQERARIAREMHDAVAHSVSVVVLQAGAAEQVLATAPERAREALVTIQDTGREAIVELRRMLGVLHDPVADASLAPQPSVDRLDALLEQVRAAGLPVELTVEGQPRRLPPGIDRSAYRIVQEGLTNALKHAGPAHASVRLRYAERALELEVLDDGRGPAGASGGGFGLLGMHERAALYGGVLAAQERPGGGYALSARLPLERVGS